MALAEDVHLCYDSVRVQIADGDLLLWRPSDNLFRQMIAIAGRGPYSHAAMAGWWGGVLMHLEMVVGGGRAVTLSSQVKRYPGRIDWYRANPGNLHPEFDRDRALEAMIRKAGSHYGFWNLIRSALSHAPVFRWFVRPSRDDRANGSLELCSQGIGNAIRAGGVDPVPNLADRATEPADLSRSPFFEYQGTLYP